MERIEDIIEAVNNQISLKIRDVLLKVYRGESESDEIKYLVRDRNNPKKLWRRV